VTAGTVGPDPNPYVLPSDLSNLLRRQVDPNAGALAIRMAEAKIASATRLQWPPNPVPEDIWTWTIELAGLIYDNPTQRGGKTTLQVSDVWLPGDPRQVILNAAAERYSPSDQPAGSFGDWAPGVYPGALPGQPYNRANSWPDPADFPYGVLSAVEDWG
jgi:hypothetical protein